MFKIHLCGTLTGHRRGFEYKSNGPVGYYQFLHFHTPFFYTVNGVRGEGAPGQCMLHRPESVITHGNTVDSEGFVNDWIQFSASDTDILPLSLSFDIPITVPEGEQFGRLISDIIKETALGDAFSDELISQGIYRILTAFKRGESLNIATDQAPHSRLLSTRMQIMNRCGEPWTLKKMAELSGYSVSRFSALYSEYFRKSPIDDLLNERLETAKRLLLLQSYRIGEVAEICGFSSIHYFSSFFKARTGVTPNSFAKHNLQYSIEDKHKKAGITHE